MGEEFNPLSTALPLVGGVLDKVFRDDARHDDQEFQKWMASHGLQMLSRDARAAGIHPLDALGFRPASGQGSLVGDTNFAALGQDISRAATAGSSQVERDQATLNKLSIERAGLENDLLRAQLGRSTGAGVPPPKPGVKIQDSKPVVSDPSGARELGVHPETVYGKGPFGTLSPFPSQQFQDYLSEAWLPNALWMLRNLWIPDSLGPSQEAAKQAGRTPGDYEWIPGLGWVPMPEPKNFGYKP